MPLIRIEAPDQPPREVQLDREAVVGREESCELFIPEKKASRRHLAFMPGPVAGSWIAQDLGSANGTWHGEQRLMRRVLSEGDTLRIGDTTLTILDLPTESEVASGGVVFTTIQKFMPDEKGADFPMLSERSNIVVIADEAYQLLQDWID